MKDVQEQLINFLEKAYELTTLSLKAAQEGRFEELVDLLDNRERAINITQSLSERLSLHQSQSENPDIVVEFNNQVNQVIKNIVKMDNIITECLEHEKNKTQFEIAKTYKNKENFRGYNLNNIK